MSDSRWVYILVHLSGGVLDGGIHLGWTGGCMHAIMCADSGRWRHSCVEVVSHVYGSGAGVGTTSVGSSSFTSTWAELHLYIRFYMCAATADVLGGCRSRWGVRWNGCNEEGAEEAGDHMKSGGGWRCSSSTSGSRCCWCCCYLVLDDGCTKKMMWRWSWCWWRCRSEGMVWWREQLPKWMRCGLFDCSGGGSRWWRKDSSSGWRWRRSSSWCCSRWGVEETSRGGGRTAAIAGRRLVGRLEGGQPSGPGLKKLTFSEITSLQRCSYEGSRGQKELWLSRETQKKFSHTNSPCSPAAQTAPPVQLFRGRPGRTKSDKMGPPIYGCDDLNNMWILQKTCACGYYIFVILESTI